MILCISLVYAPSFLVLIIFETTVQIPQVEFWGEYGYLPYGQITNTDF